MNNDLMTINGFEPSRRVSSLLKGLFRRQGQFFLLAKKTFLIGIAPLPLPFLGYIYFPVQYGYSKTFRLQLTDLHYPVGY